MSERNPRVIRSQMGGIGAPKDESEPEQGLEAEEIERAADEEPEDGKGSA